MYAFHNDSLDSQIDTAGDNGVRPAHTGNDFSSCDLDLGNEKYDDDNDDLNQSREVQNEMREKEMKDAAAMMILKLREKYLLPQSVTENLVQDVDTLYQVSVIN